MRPARSGLRRWVGLWSSVQRAVGTGATARVRTAARPRRRPSAGFGVARLGALRGRQRRQVPV
eukprot:11214132-Lingulodinium_polyedra.AAC.1